MTFALFFGQAFCVVQADLRHTILLLWLPECCSLLARCLPGLFSSSRREWVALEAKHLSVGELCLCHELEFASLGSVWSFVNYNLTGRGWGSSLHFSVLNITEGFKLVFYRAKLIGYLAKSKDFQCHLPDWGSDIYLKSENESINHWTY